MTTLIAIAFVLVAASGTTVVFVRAPLRQAVALGVHTMTLSVLFLLLQAPEVALSEIVVGTVATPLMVMFALAKIRGDAR